MRPMLRAEGGRIINITQRRRGDGQRGAGELRGREGRDSSGSRGRWRARWHHAGSRCNAVAPGFIETDITAGMTEQAVDAVDAARSRSAGSRRPKRSRRWWRSSRAMARRVHHGAVHPRRWRYGNGVTDSPCSASSDCCSRSALRSGDLRPRRPRMRTSAGCGTSPRTTRASQSPAPARFGRGMLRGVLRIERARLDEYIQEAATQYPVEYARDR